MYKPETTSEKDLLERMLDMLSSNLNEKQVLDDLFGPFEVNDDLNLRVVIIMTEGGTLASFLVDHINDWPLCFVCNTSTNSNQEKVWCPRSIQKFEIETQPLFVTHLFREEDGRFGIFLKFEDELIGMATDPRKGVACAV